jgi:hypothetical protein
MKTAAAFALLAVAVACATAPVARADGDPASDYLLTQKVFIPYDMKVPRLQQQELAALVDEANREGFTIRVAIISSSYDMGSITSLWRKPQTYARFLGAELQFVYKNRLLVVMPNGFGFSRPRHAPTRELAILSKIEVKPGVTGLVDSSRAAVEALAKGSGITLSGSTTSVKPSSTNHDRLVIVLAAAAALAFAVLARLVLRRPR